MVMTDFFATMIQTAVLSGRSFDERNRVRLALHHTAAGRRLSRYRDGPVDHLDQAAKMATGAWHLVDSARYRHPELHAARVAYLGLPPLSRPRGLWPRFPLPRYVSGRAGGERAERTGRRVEHARAVALARVGPRRRLHVARFPELVAGEPHALHHRRRS